MQNVQKKTTDAQIRANKKYSNSKWRPNIYIDKELQADIEKHFINKGYDTFNKYVVELVIEDMRKSEWNDGKLDQG